MTINFPHIESLRTQFKADSLRPSIVSIYQPNKRGQLKLVRAVLPAKAVK
jgi:hypothetical protein